MWPKIAAYLLVINLATFLVFAHDKQRARQGGWRVREDNLLGLALIGGSIGAVLGQQLLRHKSAKQSFRTALQVIITIQIGLLIGFTIL